MSYVLVALFGGYTASFLCVVLERRAVGLRPDGRSRCVCGTQIPIYRNIPVVTWLLQRGRAHCCHARIPFWYFGAELGVAGAAVACELLLPLPMFLGGAIGTMAGGIGVWLVNHFSRSSRRYFAPRAGT